MGLILDRVKALLQKWLKTTNEKMPLVFRTLDAGAHDNLMEMAKAYGKSPYGDHLKTVVEGKVRY